LCDEFSYIVLGTAWYFETQMGQYGDEVLRLLQRLASYSHRSLRCTSNHQFNSHAVIMKFNSNWHGVLKRGAKTLSGFRTTLNSIVT